MQTSPKPAIGAINQLDIDQPRQEHRFDLPAGLRQWVIGKLLRSGGEQNIYVLLVAVNIILTSIPMAATLFWLEGRVHPAIAIVLGMGYFAFHFVTYARSFILALHYSTHTSLFKKEWKWLKHIYGSFLSCFFGIPPNIYYAHHIAMHHSDDNVAPWDLSSTMTVQRDSKRNHFNYMLRFFVGIWFELPIRLWRKAQTKVLTQCVAGELFFFGTAAFLFTLKPIATFFVFLFPVAFISFAMMQGNFKQHIFVDPDEPDNNYKSTFTCINTDTNSRNFNDGYHIEHHENPSVAWHRLPEFFQKNIKKHAENDSFVFSGIGAMKVGTLVLNGQLEELADYYVNIGQPQRTKAELVAEFERRLRPTA
ncbi:MAG: fatty acid desaturase family protein [Geitlerinemataceae cyanobacterium]